MIIIKGLAVSSVCISREKVRGQILTVLFFFSLVVNKVSFYTVAFLLCHQYLIYCYNANS